MCSCASFPSRNRTITTKGTSTLRPVGVMPGSIQSISMLWVNLMTISSTSWSVPTVRETGGHFHIGRHLRDEVGRIELSQFGFAAAARHNRAGIDIGILANL